MDVGRIASGLIRPDTAATNTPPGSVKEAGGLSLEGLQEPQRNAGGASSVSRGQLESQVSDVLSRLQMVQRDLDFNIDDSTGQVVVKVIDSESGKLVRQIPSKELLELAERFEEMRSLMEGVKA
ncbi:flagellar protein FlaG [Pseudomonas xanthomarina]|uniref:Flagellar protein FlaG n=2 Tax=Stutzerimonas xanthomarina TaxID=271420 RepID=A0A1M5NCR7_9GAMM|nr:flagellar protein FlaG [Stutzerimonas xanthomarina]MCP9340784.1 flagellar protein FlaG [Stutzerimonas xanthomarina]SEH81218.1 flagellar protein FlaG [Stutzerimonas xanthomarina]SHG86773.1 flagellar protein FlaG [Stutzerimonas xanthomarina DSM 18231]